MPDAEENVSIDHCDHEYQPEHADGDVVAYVCKKCKHRIAPSEFTFGSE